MRRVAATTEVRGALLGGSRRLSTAGGCSARSSRLLLRCTDVGSTSFSVSPFSNSSVGRGSSVREGGWQLRAFVRRLSTTAEPAAASDGSARKVVSRRSADGVHYQGEVNEAMEANGEGVLIQPNGAYHEGHWRNGAPHGRGRSVGADKWTEDDGEWVAGELHGRATQRLRLDANLTATFDGEFERGIRKQGTLRVSDGRMYVGEWTPAGALRRGKYVAPRTGQHQNVMVGEWLDGGVFIGRVTLLRAPDASTAEPAAQGSKEGESSEHVAKAEQAAAGSEEDDDEVEEGLQGEAVEVSEGRFDRGVLRHGRRTVSGADGSELVYEGQFNEYGVLVQGSRSQSAPGSSTFLLLEEGAFHEGSLVKGKQTMEGQGEAEGEWNPETEVFVGTARSTAGTIEEGTFVRGRLAKGKRALADGRVLEGEWETGPQAAKFKGRARVGDVEMEGQFEGDHLEGEGKLIDHASGRRVEGQWKKGDLVRGRIVHPDGLVEEGDFLRGKMMRGRIHRPSSSSSSSS